MLMRNRLVVSLAIVFVLIASGCSGADQDVAEQPLAAAGDEPTPTSTPAPTEAPAPTATPEPTDVPEPTAEPEPTEVAEPTAAPAAAPNPSGSGCGAGVQPGITSESFEFEDRERVYEQVVPASYDDSTPMAVVLNWHGLGSNGVEQVGFSDYASLAENEGFIVIAPTGIPSPGDTRNSWELAPEQDPTRDDLAFANTLLDLVIATLCVDESRVYTTGMSNGGYFSSLLVCHMSERIAAAASVAALNHPDDCEPSRIVPYIGFHGTEDDVVPYDGSGESSLAPGEVIELFQLKILDEFTEFAVEAGCEVEPTVSDYSENVTAFDFGGCPNEVPMTFYEIEGAGHTWPGSLISLALSESIGLGITTNEINASQVSWDFFEQHALPAP